jgi:hypothetical protein
VSKTVIRVFVLLLKLISESFGGLDWRKEAVQSSQEFRDHLKTETFFQRRRRDFQLSSSEYSSIIICFDSYFQNGIKHQNWVKTGKVLRFLSIKVEFFHFW